MKRKSSTAELQCARSVYKKEQFRRGLNIMQKLHLVSNKDYGYFSKFWMLKVETKLRNNKNQTYVENLGKVMCL